MNWINQENNDNYFDKSINLWLAFESHYFSGHTKALNIILKTKQMTILHAQWDRCALYYILKIVTHPYSLTLIIS